MPLLFLNEKSWKTTCDPARADRAMADFVDAVRAVAAEDKAGTSLVSEFPLKSLEIADGYPINKWIDSSPRNRELWRKLRTLQNRSPIRSVLPSEDAAEHLEYRHEDAVVLGLGAAHLMDGIAVSLPVGAAWQADSVRVDRSELVELDDGTLEFQQDTVNVRHVSSEPHVDGFRTWIRQSRLESVATGHQIWGRRADLYPHLRFLPRTEEQMTGLWPHWVVPVRRCLERLEAAVAAWDPDMMPDGPQWQTKVSPEGQTRKELCKWPDLDKVERYFDTHVRFTPGAGRIHFRLAAGERTIHIGHVGHKIPD